MVLPHPNGSSTRLRFCWLTSYPQWRIQPVAPAQWHDLPIVGHFDRVLPTCVGSDIAGPVGACAYATPDTTRCPNKHNLIFFVRMVAVQRSFEQANRH
jgi:hypothetical protein